MRSDYRGLARYGTVGLDFVLSIVFGYAAGHWIDKKVSGRGWITLIGFAFGVAAGFRSIFATARKLQRETEAQDAADERTRRTGIRDDEDDVGDR